MRKAVLIKTSLRRMTLAALVVVAVNGWHRLEAQPALHGDLSGMLPADSLEVDGDCYVRADAVLMIPAGTVLGFVGPYRFTVYGELRVAGTEQAEVHFTCDTQQQPEGWRGLRFMDASDSCRLEYCLIENARAVGSAPDCYGGGVYLVRSNVTFDHCTFRSNSARLGGGAYVYSSDPTFTACTFSQNFAGERGGGIYASCSQPRLEYCVLMENSAVERGGIIYGLAATLFLVHCTLSGNAAPEGAGVYACATQVQLTHTIVYGCRNGVGVYTDAESSALIDYCGFYGNNAGNAAGHGIGNGFGRILRRNANGDSCDVFHNLFLDPLFVDAAAFDLHLRVGSPCIDAGDPGLPHDPDGTVADIGAIYFDQLRVHLTPPAIALESALYQNYPNPFNSTTEIRFDLPQTVRVQIKIFNTLGQEVTTLIDEVRPAGVHRVIWDSRSASGVQVASGVYVYQIKAGDFVDSKKMVLIR